MAEKKQFELWTEGYIVTGESSGASYHGLFEGETIKEAVQEFKDSLTDEYSKKCVDVENLNFWGCKFFDNEADARKSFG